MPNLGYLHERYCKDNISDIEKYKTLLECGFREYNSGGYNVAISTEANQFIISDKCMKKSGYYKIGCIRKSDGFRFQEDYVAAMCKNNDYPACDLPLSQIPDRSVKRRLESDFCKKYPKADVCQP
jgi:hypothetical protein